MTTPIGDIPASSIPAVRTWIYDGIAAQLADQPEVLVCYDEPGPNLPADIVCVGEVQQTYSPAQTVGSGGRFWLREDYTITVTVSVNRGDDDAAGVFGRARQLADLVVAVVRSDPSLGGAVDRAMPATAAHLGGWGDNNGRECEIELGIAVMNTI